MEPCGDSLLVDKRIVLDLATDFTSKQITSLALPSEYMEICKPPVLSIDGTSGCMTNNINSMDINIRESGSLMQIAVDVTEQGTPSVSYAAVISHYAATWALCEQQFRERGLDSNRIPQSKQQYCFCS